MAPATSTGMPLPGATLGHSSQASAKARVAPSPAIPKGVVISELAH